MSNSLKNGAIAGLIAGIVAGIIFTLTMHLGLSAGFPYYTFKPYSAPPLMQIALPAMIIESIFGIIYGIIFSKIYDLIPYKGISKGLLFGFGIYLIVWIRNALFVYAYGYVAVAITCLAVIYPFIFGLILGILYKVPTEKLETKKSEFKSGIIPGVITSIIFSIAIIINYIIIAYFGTFYTMRGTYPEYLTDIGFIINQEGAHIVINMFMMGIYGAFYTGFYDRIPGKDLIKGAIYGLIIWVLTDLYNSLYWLAYGSIGSAIFAGLGIPFIYIFMGLLIEGIYKKRSHVILWAGLMFILNLIISVIIGVLS
jgi:hypothetical protein